MSIILFIILFIVVLFIIGLSFIASIIRGLLSFLGLGRRNSNGYHNTREQARGTEYRQQNRTRQQERTTSGWHYSPEADQKRQKRKKIFEANEGEYVDFEEVNK